MKMNYGIESKGIKDRKEESKTEIEVKRKKGQRIREREREWKRRRGIDSKKANLRCSGTKYSPLWGITHTDVALAESGLQWQYIPYGMIR